VIHFLSSRRGVTVWVLQKFLFYFIFAFFRSVYLHQGNLALQFREISHIEILRYFTEAFLFASKARQELKSIEKKALAIFAEYPTLRKSRLDFDVSAKEGLSIKNADFDSLSSLIEGCKE